MLSRITPEALATPTHPLGHTATPTATAEATAARTTVASPVDAFLDAARTATIPTATAWADDCVIDATVPGWRFTMNGVREIKRVLSRWFADPGSYEELRRVPLPDGELVEFLLTWTEGGIPHAAHQAHVITVLDGRIVHQTIFCGGRWPADLLAEMAEAAR